MYRKGPLQYYFLHGCTLHTVHSGWPCAQGKVTKYAVYKCTHCTLPERLLDATIVSNILPLGVDTVQLDPLTVHLHTVVRVLVCM